MACIVDSADQCVFFRERGPLCRAHPVSFCFEGEVFLKDVSCYFSLLEEGQPREKLECESPNLLRPWPEEALSLCHRVFLTLRSPGLSALSVKSR